MANGIWLCQTCAKLVDSDELRYERAKLLEWKHDAEAAAAKALEHRKAPPAESVGVFLEAERLMPKLIGEMRDDVRADHSELVREFVVLPHSRVGFSSRKPRFVYYIDSHPDLLLQTDWLEEMGLVTAITPSNVPIYRLLPEFMGWLRGDG